MHDHINLMIYTLPISSSESQPTNGQTCVMPTGELNVDAAVWLMHIFTCIYVVMYFLHWKCGCWTFVTDAVTIFCCHLENLVVQKIYYAGLSPPHHLNRHLLVLVGLLFSLEVAQLLRNSIWLAGIDSLIDWRIAFQLSPPHYNLAHTWQLFLTWPNYKAAAVAVGINLIYFLVVHAGEAYRCNLWDRHDWLWINVFLYEKSL